MTPWIGHYAGNPVEWFIVEAETQDEAIFAVDGTWGEPDEERLREFKPPGGDAFMVNFRLQLRDEPLDEGLKVEVQSVDLELYGYEDYIRERANANTLRHVNLDKAPRREMK